jgi:hypothetical protein
MVLGVPERKNRDFFRQVTLVVEAPATSKFEAKWQFKAYLQSPPEGICRSRLPGIL